MISILALYFKDTDDEDDPDYESMSDEEEDSVRVPSCSELRRCGLVLTGGQVVGSIIWKYGAVFSYCIPQDVENRAADPPACDPHQ